MNQWAVLLSQLHVSEEVTNNSELIKESDIEMPKSIKAAVTIVPSAADSFMQFLTHLFLCWINYPLLCDIL